MVARSKRLQRPQNRTLLLVAEGETEEAFLTHLKRLYVNRESRLSVTIKCARGKGAAHVVDVAIRQSKNFAFDQVAAFLDTDTDWNDAVSRTAADGGVKVLCSHPCIEGMLLRAMGAKVPVTTTAMKKRFAPHVRGDGLIPENYAAAFGHETMQRARLVEPTLDELLLLLGSLRDGA